MYLFYILNSVYNSQLEDNSKNTSSLPRQGFEPGNPPCGTRKELFCARLLLPLAAPSREYFFFLRLLHESIEYWACEIAAIYCTYNILSLLSRCIKSTYSRTGCALTCSLTMRTDYFNLYGHVMDLRRDILYI